MNILRQMALIPLYFIAVVVGSLLFAEMMCLMGHWIWKFVFRALGLIAWLVGF